MINFWEKGLNIRIANNHHLDVARCQSVLVSMAPPSVQMSICRSLIRDNLHEPRSIVLSDSWVLSANHNGCVVYANDPARKVAAMGLMAAIAEARSEILSSTGFKGGINEYNQSGAPPLWRVVIHLSSIDDVFKDDRYAADFITYYRSFLKNCIQTGMYAIFCSESHGFVMSDRGKQLLQSTNVIGSGPTNNQTIAHALGFFKPMQTNHMLYMRGRDYGDSTRIDLDDEKWDVDENLGLLESDAVKINEGVLDTKEVSLSIDKIQKEILERIDFFVDDKRTIRSHTDHDALNTPINGFNPDLYVSSLLMVLGSYGVDKKVKIGSLAGHMNLTNDEVSAVAYLAQKRNPDALRKIEGY